MEQIRVIYDSMVYFKIMHWVTKAGNDEISGFGSVVKEDGVYRVVDAILLPQKNGRAHTEIDGADVGKAEFLLKDADGEMRLWWHSHVKMGVFWSDTDTDTIKELGQHGWILATVFNQNWQHRSAVYYGKDIDIFVDELDTRHKFSLTEEMCEPWDEEFEKNVEAHKVIHIGGSAKKASKAFRQWRKGLESKLTKRERRLVQDRKNPVYVIAETRDYGRVYWMKGDEYKKFVTPRARPDKQTEIFLREFWEQITEIHYIHNERIDNLVWAGDWHDATPLMKSFTRLYEGKEDEIASPAKGNGNGAAHVDRTVIMTEKDLQDMYQDWDALPEPRRRIIRLEWNDQPEAFV